MSTIDDSRVGSVDMTETEGAIHVEPPDGRAVVEVSDLKKTFRRANGAEVRAIDDVTLSVEPGEFVVLLGPSGCGKTTLLRSIAGLETPDSGEIKIHDVVSYSSSAGVNLPAERRKISMIFQSYALWPHMNVFQNVAYPLKARRRGRLSRAEMRERVMRVLSMVGVSELEQQYPGQMSGGQQQRVALARALVVGSDLVLFDEPLSNVDAKVREQLRLELLSMQRELKFAAIYVTHDQIEAMELADRIAVMRTGRVEQLDSPREIYERPSSRYVSDFIGTSNEITGAIVSRDGHRVVLSTDIGEVAGVLVGDEVELGSEVVATWRPERCRLAREASNTDASWQCVIEAALFVGSHVEHVVRIGSHRFRIWSGVDNTLGTDDEAWLVVPQDCVRIFTAEAAG